MPRARANGCITRFQSTLPRRERPRHVYVRLCGHVISIHAPAKGATSSMSVSSPDRRISIHAPAKGATDIQPAQFLYTLYFNPRSREGSDNKDGIVILEVRKFQSTLPRRERHCNSYTLHILPGFQSTLPRRERHELGRIRAHRNNFNPRSREGSD